MRTVKYFCKWWRQSRWLKKGHCTQPLVTLSSNIQLCLSQCRHWNKLSKFQHHQSLFHRCWCENWRPVLYREVLLVQKLMPIIKEFSYYSVFQQDSAPAHCAQKTVDLSSTRHQTSFRNYPHCLESGPEPSQLQERSSADEEKIWRID